MKDWQPHEPVDRTEYVVALERERDELRACLHWYVENDDTNEMEDKDSSWLKGKRRAMKALGMKVDE